MNPPRGHLLLVDDHDVNRAGFARLLRHMGFSVSEAAGGQAALDLAGQEHFDLVLLDIMLPDVNGMVVLERLRGTWSIDDLPVIMLTARDQSEVMVEAFKRGANDYVTKPLDLDVTMARIKALLARKAARPVPQAPRCLTPGALLRERYRIDQILGQGGMGAVYKAQDTVTLERVAIKEMQVALTNPAMQASAVKQFRLESRILQQLDHPSLVRVLDAFEASTNHYIVMALVEGVTLETVVQQATEFIEIPDVLQWAEALCDVLSYLHSRTPPVIFRDLKPSNVMVNAHGGICLVDFGIAREFESDSTTTSFIKGAGSPGFSPVEQFGGNTTDPRSDVYSLGATLYALLTFTVPPMSVQLVAGEATLADPSTINPSVSAELAAVVMKMMGLRKEDRYPSIDEARAAMRAAVGAQSQASGRADGA